MKSNSSFLHRFLIIAASILVMFIILLGALPSFLSTEWANHHLITPLINSRISGSIHIDKIRLTWSGDQKIKGFILKDPSGTSILSIESCKSHTSFWKLLYSPPQLGSIDCKGLTAKFDDVLLSDVDVHLELPIDQNSLTVHLEGKTQHGDVLGGFIVNSTIEQLNSNSLWDWTQNFPPLFKPDGTPNIKLSASIKNFPVEVLNRFINLVYPTSSKLMSDALGTQLDATINQAIENDSIILEGKVRSPNLKAEIRGRLLNGQFEIIQPGIASLRAVPELISHVNPLLAEPLQIQSDKELFLQFIIYKFVLPLEPKMQRQLSLQAELQLDQLQLKNGNTFSQMKVSLEVPEEKEGSHFFIDGFVKQQDLPGKFEIKGEITHEAFQMEGKLDFFPLVADVSLRSIHARVSGYSLSEMEANFTAEVLKKDSHFAKIFGDHLNLDGKAKLGFSHKWDLQIPHFKIQASNDLIHGLFTGSFDGRKDDVLHAQGNINYRLTSSLIEEMGLAKQGKPRIYTPVDLNMEIASLKIPFFPFHPSHLKLKGKMEIPSLSLATPDGIILASLHQLVMPLEINGSEDLATLDVTARTVSTLSKKEGFLAVYAKFSNWLHEDTFDFSQPLIKVHTEIKQFPVVLLEGVSRINDLTTLIGPSLDIRLALNNENSQEAKGFLDFSLSGTQFHAKASLKVDQALTLKDPASPMIVDWTLTPERFSILRKKLKGYQHPEHDDLQLKEATSVFMRIADIHYPLDQKDHRTGETVNWPHAAGTVHLTMDKVALLDRKMNQMTILDAISAKLATHALARAVAFELHSKGKVVGRTAELAELSLSGLVEDLLTETNEMNKDLSITLDAKARQAPIVLLCNFACISDGLIKQVDTLIGDRLDADVYFKIKQQNGPLRIGLRGNQGSLDLDGQLNSGIFTLNKPLQASVTVTPNLTRSLLPEIVPLLSSAIAAEGPVKIQIEPEGFSLPLDIGDISKIAIGRGTLDLGKVYFSNEGTVGVILSLLNYSPRETNKLSIWFTPLYFNMHQGLLRCERMDMLLVNLFHAALWGKVDFVKDKVSLMIGLSGPTIERAFGVSGLSKDALLQLPLRGTTSSASIDKSKATTRITALIAQNQGSPQGVLVGGLLDILGGTYGEKKPPQPTTQPFPWESDEEYDQTAVKEPSKIEKAVFPLPQLINSLEKGAKKLLR